MSIHFLSKIIKFIAILAFFTPLIISKSTLFPFIFGKAVAFQILVELMLIVYLIGLTKFSDWRPRFSILTWALLAFFVVLVLSTVFSVDPYISFWSKHERMEGLFTLSHYFAFFLVLTSVFRKKEDWLGFLRWSVIAALLVSFYALVQLLNLPGFVKGIGGISGTLGNSSFLATYLIFNSFFVLFLFLEKRKSRQAASSKSRNFKISKSKKEKIYKSSMVSLTPSEGFYLGSFLFFNFLLPYTTTRAAFYGQFLGLFAFFGLYGFFLASARLKKIIAAGLILAVVLISLVFIFKDSHFVKSNRILARVTDISLKSATIQQRFAGWRSGLEGFKTRPLFGWGQENYYIVFYKFIDPYFYGPTEVFDRPHNKYVDILVANGALGLLAYLGIFAVLFFWIWQQRPRTSSFDTNHSSLSAFASSQPLEASEARQEVAKRSLNNNFIPFWFFSLILAYVVQNTLLFDMPTSYPLFFLTLAFANFIFVGQHFAISGNVPSANAKLLFLQKERQLGLAPVFCFVLIPVIIYILWWGNLKPYGESRLLIKALNSLSTDPAASLEYSRRLFRSPSFVKVEGRNAIVNQLIAQDNSRLKENSTLMSYDLMMVDELNKGLKESPWNYRYYSSLVNLYEFLGSADPSYFKKAEETGRLALEIFPRDINFLLEIFAIRFQAGDLDSAEAVLKEVLAKAPNSHLGHWYLAMIYHKRQDFESAKKEAETAISLGFSYANRLNAYNFLASTYFNLNDYNRALDYFLEAYKSFPQNLQLLSDIAVTYNRLGDKAKAKEWILKVLEISPNSADEVNKFLQQIGD